MTGLQSAGADGLAIHDALSVREGRERYFARSGIEPGYDARWVTLRAGGVPVLMFPNTAARVRAVRLHDLHHVVTGYDTSWTGEAEISAWEIASGCAGFAAAWVLNLGAFAVGLCIAPRRLFRAFVRGRHTENLYHAAGAWDEALLDGRVGELRARLGLDHDLPPARAADGAAFAGWAVAAVAFVIWLPALGIWLFA
jgi:hypothetical protein